MSDIEINNTRQRITFATSRTLAYVSVLELGLIWERSLRRAGVALKYSQGFNPRPKIQFAAPLPVGCGSKADLLDLKLHTPSSAEAVFEALKGKTPADLNVLTVQAVPESESALAEQLQETEYSIWLSDIAPAQVEAAIQTLLEKESQPMVKRGRKYRGKTYDLRPLILELYLTTAPAPWTGIWMRLKARPSATGRPDEVLKALELQDIARRCTRERLILAAPPEKQEESVIIDAEELTADTES